MNRRKLERHLIANNCVFHSHGANHDKWRRVDAKLGTTIPRHDTIKPSTVKAICKDLGVPPPLEK